MSDFRVHDSQTAPEAARPLLDRAGATFGFVPNLFGVLAESPAALEGYLALNAALGKSSLSAAEQQVVLLATSFENECNYCMAAHSAVGLAQGLSPEAVAALREGRGIDDARLEALHAFTARVVRARGWVEADELQAFEAAGFTRAQALEVVLGVALKTLSNYANHLADTPLDAAFAGQRWEKPAQAQA